MPWEHKRSVGALMRKPLILWQIYSWRLEVIYSIPLIHTEQRESEFTWRVIDNLIEIGKDRGKTSAQIALNWILQQPGITAPIMGARTLEQLKENLGSTGWQLSEEEMNKLKKASDIPLPYPYRFTERYTRRKENI